MANKDTTPSKTQFLNADIIRRYEYVNTGKASTPDAAGVVGDTSLLKPYSVKEDGSAFPGGANKALGYPDNAIGVYSAFPSMTPKYVQHAGTANGHVTGQFNGLARMYLPVGNDKRVTKIIDSIKKKNDSQLTAVATQLLGVSGDNAGPGYLDFILMQVSQAYEEKYQVSEVLEDNYVTFFFGQRAPMWTFSGALMNTYQDDWTMNMWRLYSELGRGTQLAKRGLLLNIRYDSVIVGGVMTRFQWDLSAANELFTSFSFSFLVKTVHPIRGSKALPTNISGMGTANSAGFTNVNIQANDDTYRSVRPTISESDDDTAINEQTAATSDNVSESEKERIQTALRSELDEMTQSNARVAREGVVNDIYAAAERQKAAEEIAFNTTDVQWDKDMYELGKANAMSSPLDAYLAPTTSTASSNPRVSPAP
jgi:hypothetical protein